MGKSCEIAAKLMDKSDSEQLTLKEKLKLKVHNSYCKGCRKYNEFSKSFTDLFKKIKDNPPVLSTSEKEKLKDKLAE